MFASNDLRRRGEYTKMVTLKVYIGLLVLGSVLTLPVNVHSELELQKYLHSSHDYGSIERASTPQRHFLIVTYTLSQQQHVILIGTP